MNEAEFTTLCEEQMHSLYRVSMAILHHHSDAQDAVQQAFMKAWTSRSRMYVGAEKAWLMQITINECRNVQRQRMRMMPVEQLPEDGYMPPDTALRDAIQTLPEKWRLPLLLKYMEGMSENETARALSISRTVLKGRLFRARKALKKALDEEMELE